MSVLSSLTLCVSHHCTCVRRCVGRCVCVCLPNISGFLPMFVRQTVRPKTSEILARFLHVANAICRGRAYRCCCCCCCCCCLFVFASCLLRKGLSLSAMAVGSEQPQWQRSFANEAYEAQTRMWLFRLPNLRWPVQKGRKDVTRLSTTLLSWTCLRFVATHPFFAMPTLCRKNLKTRLAQHCHRCSRMLTRESRGDSLVGILGCLAGVRHEKLSSLWAGVFTFFICARCTP